MTRLLLVFCILSSSLCVSAQKDTAYYESYETMLTTRFYFSQKYTSFNFRDQIEGISLNYRPNTTLNMGVGATYKWATLNLAYGFGFLNPNEHKGETKYLDLQLHQYTRKLVLDGYGQFYNGFYLNDRNLIDQNGDYYQRPDIRVRLFGLSGQYIFSSDKFSYRAVYLQNEWQKKSAGSLLVGWGFYMGLGDGDSTVVPSAIRTPVGDATPYDFRFIETGPNVGYAYTLVIRKNFYLSGSGVVSFDYGAHKINQDNEETKKTSFSPNTTFRLFGGYNSPRWAISLVYLNDTVRVFAKDTSRRIDVNTGNYRLNFVYRFKPRHDVREKLDKVIK